MTNPYEILGIKSDANKAEIDAAYNRLTAEYRNSGSSDKIQELTTAYNQAVSQYNDNIILGNSISENINPYYAPAENSDANIHKASDKSLVNNCCSSENNTDGKQSEYQNSGNFYTNDPNDVFGSVKRLIELERYTEAENLLNSVNYKDTAKWHYLYGKMCLGSGWMNQAAVHFQRAFFLDSSNEEYKSAYTDIFAMKKGITSSHKINIDPKAALITGVSACAIVGCSTVYVIGTCACCADMFP